MTKQYYVIDTTGLIYNDRQKIIVTSKKELLNFVKKEFKWLNDYFIYNQKEFDLSKIKKVYKRIEKTKMFNSENNKQVGLSFAIKAKDINDDMIDIVCYWCERIPKRDLIKFAGFKEIDQ